MLGNCDFIAEFSAFSSGPSTEEHDTAFPMLHHVYAVLWSCAVLLLNQTHHLESYFHQFLAVGEVTVVQCFLHVLMTVFSVSHAIFNTLEIPCALLLTESLQS